ncbi:MAG: O-antigen ligase family protein [Gaiellaceae bacterium]
MFLTLITTHVRVIKTIERRYVWLGIALIGLVSPLLLPLGHPLTTAANFGAVAVLAFDVIDVSLQANRQSPTKVATELATTIRGARRDSGLYLVIFVWLWLQLSTAIHENRFHWRGLVVPAFAWWLVRTLPSAEAARLIIQRTLLAAVAMSIVVDASTVRGVVSGPSKLLLGQARLGGLWDSPQSFCFAAVLLAGVSWPERRTPLGRLSLALAGTALVVGGSRGDQLAALISLVAAPLLGQSMPFGRRFVYGLLPVILLGIYLRALFTISATYHPTALTGRAAIWPVYWHSALAHLGIGQGIDAAQRLQMSGAVPFAFNSPHDAYLAFLLAGGLIAGLAGSLMVLWPIFILRKRAAPLWTLVLATFLPLSLITETRFSFNNLGLAETALLFLNLLCAHAHQETPAPPHSFGPVLECA